MCTLWSEEEEIVRVGDQTTGNFKASVDIEIPVGSHGDKYKTKIFHNGDITSGGKELTYLEVQLPPAC